MLERCLRHGSISFRGFGGFIEAINNFANFTSWESSFIGFGIERDKQNADVVSQLVNDPIARTFAFLNVAIFDADFENGMGRARNLIPGQLPLSRSSNSGCRSDRILRYRLANLRSCP